MNNLHCVGRATLCILFGFLFFFFSPIQETDAVLLDGDLDTTFQTYEGVEEGFNSNVEVVAFQSDGKILVGGYFTSYKGVPAAHLVRLNTDGSIDTSFSLDGDGFDGYVVSIVVQPDGKIIVAEEFGKITRLNSDGSLDSTFNTGTGGNSTIRSVKLQEDGKILIVGWLTSFNGEAVNYLARLNPDGSLDSTFAQEGGGLSDAVYSIAIQDDGKYLVTGQFDYYNGINTPGVVRLNTDGSFDDTFSISTITSGNYNSVAIQEDGKILIGGSGSYYTEEPEEYEYLPLVRLNSDGSEDTTFDLGTGFEALGIWWNYPEIYSIVIQSDGKIVVCGNISRYNSEETLFIARLNSDGSLDSSFYHSNIGFNSAVYDLYLGPDDRIFALGEFLSYDTATCQFIVSMDSEGNVEDLFLQYPEGFNGPVSVVKVQADGKILAAGMFTTYGGVYSPGIVRLNEDGSIDDTFSQTGRGIMWGEYIGAMAIQEDGKILLGGSIFLYDDTETPFFVRLNSDGTLDTSFNMGAGFSYEVNSILIQNDGKIIVVGGFDSYNEAEVPAGIIRLNTDGSVDTSFNPDQEVKYVNIAALQEDGKIIVVKDILQPDYSSIYIPMRLNTDGSVDTTFNSDGYEFNSYMENPVLLDDGKILFSGYFDTYGEQEVFALARLNSDGTLDTTFSLGIVPFDGFGGLMFPTIQPDGKILVEKISEISGLYEAELIRLNSDGSVDESFSIQFPYFDSNEVGWFTLAFDMEVLSNGKILMAGGFKSYNGENNVAYLARLNIHHQPTVSSLKTNSIVNPIGVTTYTPNFSALITDSKTADTILKYQVQVSTSPLFTSYAWDSGIRTFTTPITNNSRTPDIPYDGTALTLNGTKYYWRVRVWDTLGDASEWSEVNNFTMANYGLSAPSLSVSPSSYTNINTFNISWPQGNIRTKYYEYKTGGMNSWVSTTTRSINVSAYVDGANTIQVRSVDNAGNRSEIVSQYYYYDSVAPSVPTNLKISSGAISWSNSTDGHSGVLGYEYKVGLGDIWSSTTSTHVSPTSLEGIFYIRALDNAGNKSDIVSFKMDDEEIDIPKISFSIGSLDISTDKTEGNVPLKSGGEILMTILVSDITIDGDPVSQVSVEIEGKKTILALDETKGIYTAKITIPSNRPKGTILELKQIVEYESGEESVKGVNVVVDPYGYVYTSFLGKENRLEGASVYLYSYSNDSKTLYEFNDGTSNPQITDANGEYSFLIPNGSYILVVEKDGYQKFTSGIIEISNNAVEQNIRIRYQIPIYLYVVAGGVAIIGGAILFAKRGKKLA